MPDLSKKGWDSASLVILFHPSVFPLLTLTSPAVPFLWTSSFNGGFGVRPGRILEAHRWVLAKFGNRKASLIHLIVLINVIFLSKCHLVELDLPLFPSHPSSSSLPSPGKVVVDHQTAKKFKTSRLFRSYSLTMWSLRRGYMCYNAIFGQSDR